MVLRISTASAFLFFFRIGCLLRQNHNGCLIKIHLHSAKRDFFFFQRLSKVWQEMLYFLGRGISINQYFRLLLTVQLFNWQNFHLLGWKMVFFPFHWEFQQGRFLGLKGGWIFLQAISLKDSLYLELLIKQWECNAIVSLYRFTDHNILKEKTYNGSFELWTWQ